MAWLNLNPLTTLVLLLYLICINFSTSSNFNRFPSGSKPFLNVQGDSILPILDKVKARKEFGFLHTIKAYAEWSKKEESLVNVFVKRLEQLKLDRQVMKRFLGCHRTKRCMNKLLRFIRKSIKYKGSFVYLRQLGVTLNTHSKEEWIGFEDLQMSLTGMLNLQKTYLIPAEKISNGLNTESKFGGFLSNLDCIIIGVYSLIKNRFVTAALWLQAGKLDNLMKYASKIPHTIFPIAIQTHNLKLFTTLSPRKDFTNDVVDDLYQVPITKEVLPPAQMSNKLLHINNYRGTDPEFRFTKICNGYSLQLSNVLAKLRCYLEKRKHPYLYINPIKVEQLSENPSILQFFEIINNSSMEIIEREMGSQATTTHMWVDNDNVAQPLTQSAPVSATTSARMTITNFGRSFKNTHFLMNILTGLLAPNDPNNNMYNEHVYGRHFRLHTDGFYTENLINMPVDDDMVASMVLYLTLPIIGGCTAFVNVGVCSRTVQRSAIFWYNMYRNGTYTKQLAHGGCPVYHGYKMSISFFFKYNTNWNKRMCSLNKLE